MNSSSSTTRDRLKARQQDTMPLFFTGLSCKILQSNSTPEILCKSCNKPLEDDSDPEQLCSDCIISPKKVKTSSSENGLKSPYPSKSTPQPTSSKDSALSAKPPVPPSTPKTPREGLLGQYPSHSGNAQQTVSYPSQSFKARSDVRQRLHSRSQTAPYHTSFNQNRSAASSSNRQRSLSQASPVDHFQHFRNTHTEYEKHRVVPSFDQNLELSGQIWDLYYRNKQTEAIYNTKMALWDRLQRIVHQGFPRCALYVVGSSMTGLGVQSSDMDMCLMLTDDELDQKTEAINILRRVRNLLRKNGFGHYLQVIPARVPILKFTDPQSGTEVDLNINNATGVRNTQLLTSYAGIDNRLKPLIVLVKLWARFYDINDAKTGSLSSYTLVLMVIHYLQYRCNPPVLPSLQILQPDKYHPESDIRQLKPQEDLPNFRSVNGSDLDELFIGFLNYYGNEFDYGNSAISVRLGTVLPRVTVASNESPKNKRTDWKFFCVEEPFDLTNVARSIYKVDVFDYIKFVFDLSWKQMSRHRHLNYAFS